MHFNINSENRKYTLPRVLYDMEDDKCFIYAIQNEEGPKDKTIERYLYKINKNIEDIKVHPSKLYSLILFINELRKNKVKKVVIPSMQILSYQYHELLSKKAKVNMENAKMNYQKYRDSYHEEKYNNELKWYSRVYNKENKISYLKTEELFNLIYRLLEHDKQVEIINEVNIQGDYLLVKIK